ncbi:hypothetical protein [Microbacterium lacticum]
MVREAVELHDQPLPDEPVDRMPVDPHLLAHLHTQPAHEHDEARLEPRIGQDGCQCC